MKRSTCRSCRAPIGFVVLAKTRKEIPLDLLTVDTGLVVYPWGRTEDGITLGCVESKEGAKPLKGRGVLYRSHFETCPDAKRHRKAS